MDWIPNINTRGRLHKKRPHFEKSSSEPSLSDHFTPRFPNNLKHLIHEYITVDELRFYRKRKPAEIEDEFHNKDHIRLYDDSQPIIPFSALKSEYTKQFCRSYSSRSKSVPNKFDLNATTDELLKALQYDFVDSTPKKLTRPKTAHISGDIEIENVDDLFKPKMIPYAYAKVRQPHEPREPREPMQPESSIDNRKSCTLKLHGELSYSPEHRSEYKRHSTFERSKSIPQVNNIQFHGEFRGIPEYRDNFKTQNQFIKSEPAKVKDHLSVNPMTAIISPSSEYSDKFKELDLRSIERKKYDKNLDNFGVKNNSVFGRLSQHNYPEYFDKFKDPKIKKFPDRAKPKSPILSITGHMDYKPEYRSTYVDFPRRRPVTLKPENHFDFFQQPRKPSPIRNAIIANRFNPRVAVIEPTKNVHHQTGIDETSYLCSPEVRRARREILIKERPPLPSKTIAAAIRCTGDIFASNEEDEDRKYNEKSRIVSPKLSPPIKVTIENYDEPNKKPTTILRSSQISPTFGRRSSSIQYASSVDATHRLRNKRNQTKIIEGNVGYMKKKSSLSSTATTTDDEYSAGLKKLNDCKSVNAAPSFVVLKDPSKENRWLKASSWY